MRTPRWLVPTLAVVAAVAVGVTATLFATRFAEPVTVHSAPTHIEVPVLAPVTAELSLEELLADGDDIPVSPTVGTEEVVLPGSVPDGAVPEELADLLDRLDAADDPADALPPATSPGADAPADPCADPAPGVECPDGLAGTILALGGELPPLTVWSTGGNNATCPAPEPNSVRFWARVNAPVTFNLRISQGTPRRQVVETTDEQVERWLDEAGADGSAEAWIEHCIEIVDLEPDVPVFVYLDATDALDRRATRALTLAVGDGLDIPPTRIHPIGDSTVFVSAPHQPDTVTRMFVLGGDGETEPRCRYDGSASFPLVRPASTVEVDAAYLDANDYEPAYTRRTNATFAVPPNTQLVVCVGWFPAHDPRPTFDRDTPLRVSEYRMTSPDVVAPVVTLTDVELTEPVAEDGIRILATTENGQWCGSWSGPPEPPATGATLCDFGALLGRTDAGGSLVLTTEVDTPEGEAVNRVLLDVGLLSCVHGCSGRTRAYDVELSKFIRPGRLCSDDCRINVGEIVGVARIRATWPVSTAGTGEGWLLGAWREGAASLPRDPTPQLDTSSRFTVTPTGERAFRATAAIHVDRPVSAVAELFWVDPVPGVCPRPGGTVRWESTGTLRDHTLVFEGLCAGLAYGVTLTLTAADGAVSVYRYASPVGETRLWLGAGFTTPGERLPVVVADVRISTGDPTRVIVLRGLEVVVGGIDSRMLLPAPDQRCWIGDIHGLRSGRSAAIAGEVVTVRVSAWIVAATNPVAESTVAHPTRCREGTYAESERLEFAGHLSYDDFVAGATVTMTDPDTGYSVQVRLTDELEG